MLTREPTITNKKRSEKGRTICEIGTASPPRHPRIPHPVRTFTPTTTPNSGVARRGRAREGETAFATMSASPSSQITHFQKVKTIIQKNQTIQFPLTSKGENYNLKKSNYPIYLTSKSENYNLKN